MVAHILLSKDCNKNIKDCISDLNNILENILPEGLSIVAYSIHDSILPYSPTTLKKDKNSMAKQLINYYQVLDDNLYSVEFVSNDNCIYSKEYDIIKNNKGRVLKK